MNFFCDEALPGAIALEIVLANQANEWLREQSTFVQNWLKATGISLTATTQVLVPTPQGLLEKVTFFVSDPADIWQYASLPEKLPMGCYTLIHHDLTFEHVEALIIAWGLACYNFSRYHEKNTQKPQLVVPSGHQAAKEVVRAIFLARDLINTPTEDLGPQDLAHVSQVLAQQHGATVHVIENDELKENFLAIYAVGRAGHQAPCLIDLTWGDLSHPRLTLIGKGVCFDSGGLDIKPASAMRFMKKDMGGAAYVLGLASLIMSQHIPICLRVLIPAVENAISSDAYRPGDVLKTHKGITIEIGNTDAEGRVILADALWAATQSTPDLIIDVATLTGAARIALGTDIPVFFTNEAQIAANLMQSCETTGELVWQLPLYQPYREFLNSSIAHISNDSSSSYGGALTAALFLKEFIQEKQPWIHFDVMAWNLKSKPGRPEGGEAMGLRTIFNYIKKRYGD